MCIPVILILFPNPDLHFHPAGLSLHYIIITFISFIVSEGTGTLLSKPYIGGDSTNIAFLKACLDTAPFIATIYRLPSLPFRLRSKNPAASFKML